MELGDILKTEVLGKLKDIAKEQMSAVQRERVERYEKEYFRTTDEMVEYMRNGGKVVPLVKTSGYEEGYSMRNNDTVDSVEMIYNEAGYPMCVHHGTYTITEFKAKSCFKYKSDGFIMHWKKG